MTCSSACAINTSQVDRQAHGPSQHVLSTESSPLPFEQVPQFSVKDASPLLVPSPSRKGPSVYPAVQAPEGLRAFTQDITCCGSPLPPGLAPQSHPWRSLAPEYGRRRGQHHWHLHSHCDSWSQVRCVLTLHRHTDSWTPLLLAACINAATCTTRNSNAAPLGAAPRPCTAWLLDKHIRVIQAALTCVGQVGSQGGSPCLVAPASMLRRQQHQADALHQLGSKLAHAHAGGCRGAVQQLHGAGPHYLCQGCQLSTLACFEDGSQCVDNACTRRGIPSHSSTSERYVQPWGPGVALQACQSQGSAAVHLC